MPRETIYAIGYARVSTPKQAVEGDSLDVQAERIRRACIQNEGWALFPDNRVFQEPFTGTTDARPVYEHILKLIRSNPGKVRYLLVTAIDRFSREGSLKYQQMKRDLAAEGVELRDLGGVIQAPVNSLEHLGFEYDWSLRSPSAHSEVVLAESYSHERSAILTRLVGAQIRLTQDGYHVGRPEDGYVVRRIKPEGKKRCAQFPDPDRAHFFREMFRLRAEGVHSDAAIVERINALGFASKVRNRWDAMRTTIVGRRPGVPLTVKQLQLIIQRPVYCGIICEKWTKQQPIRSRGGESLVSIEMFNRANHGKVFIQEDKDGTLALVYDRRPERLVAKRQRFNVRFPYKNVAMCPRCGKPLVASFSRGKSGRYFGAYHCARTHARYAVRKTELESAFSEYLARIRLSDRALDGFARTLFEQHKRAKQDLVALAARTAEAIGVLEEKKSQMVDAFAAAVAPPLRKDLERRVEELDGRIAVLRNESQSMEISEDDIHGYIEQLRTIVEHPANLLKNTRTMKEQLALFGLFFDRFPTYDEIVNGTPQLSVAFRVSGRSDTEKSRLMNVPSLGWNSLEREILKWKDAAYVVDIVSERIRVNEDDDKKAGRVIDIASKRVRGSDEDEIPDMKKAA